MGMFILNCYIENQLRLGLLLQITAAIQMICLILLI